MLDEVRTQRLADIRKAQNLTQIDVADAMKISQSRVSRIEKGEIDRAELATLRAYVEELGGRLRLVADFGDELLTVAD